ncbi:hypothetical protein L1049_015984 [Liquidambar formosana]|uniref:Ternary complex factor MIP1 leucine-zipper domain-containing protein n=1 Tax=Liquidambar formosana TaxID=63359 RepID=A0AAP0S0L5_LIQFO
MHEVKWRGSSLKPLKFLEVTAPRHKRSKSDPPRRKVEENKLNNIFEASPRLKSDMGQLKSCVETKKRQSPNTEVQNSLKEEIVQLQKGLQDQFVVRRALEEALECRSFPHDLTNEIPMLKPAQNLIKEIAVLELQVVYLEQYLLSLYRKTFDQPSLILVYCG